jgi:hypothetical protein
MKKVFVPGFILLLWPLCGPWSVAAQGTLYLSNLNEPAHWRAPHITATRWSAQKFQTGGDAGGYVLNAVQLTMDDSLGSPTGFSVSLHSIDVASNPGVAISVLSGVMPSLAGVYTYTASSVTLLPLTEYFIVASATSSSPEGAYLWKYAETADYQSLAGWQMSLHQYAGSGSSWGVFGTTPYHFGISATPVPEASTIALTGMGIALFGFARLVFKL